MEFNIEPYLLAFAKKKKEHIEDLVKDTNERVICMRAINDFLVFGEPMTKNQIKTYIQECGGVLRTKRSSKYRTTSETFSDAIQRLEEEKKIEFDPIDRSYTPTQKIAGYHLELQSNYIYFHLMLLEGKQLRPYIKNGIV